MTALIIVGSALGYFALGSAILWLIARVGGLDRKENPLVLVTMVVGWPLTAFIATIIGLVFKSGGFLSSITSNAFSARDSAREKENRLEKLREEKEKELREAIRLLDRELEEVEAKRNVQKYWAPARVNITVRQDQA